MPLPRSGTANIEIGSSSWDGEKLMLAKGEIYCVWEVEIEVSACQPTEAELPFDYVQFCYQDEHMQELLPHSQMKG